MKKIRPILPLLSILILGLFFHSCTNIKVEIPKKEKSETCNLLSFRVDEKKNPLDHTIDFEIDHEQLTVTGTYLSMSGNQLPGLLIPSFTTNGKSSMVNNDTIVKSDTTMISFAAPFSFTVVAENGDSKTYTVTLEVEELKKEPGEGSATCDLLSFKIERSWNTQLNNDISFLIDKNQLTVSGGIYLKWIDRENPEMLKPTFTTNGERVFVNGQTVVSNQDISFADDFSLVVRAENGEFKAYTVSLNFPQINRELPVLHIHRDPSTIVSKTTYLTSVLEMRSPTTTSGWWSKSDAMIEIRGRGNSTWNDPEKKSYRIKFPVTCSPIGLDHTKERDLVILAQDQDKSFLRNHLAFEMSRILLNPSENYHDPNAVLFTPCSQFVNVYMNGNYHGLYQMSDNKEKGKGRIDVETLTAAEGNNATLITGGHILESDIHGANPPERFNSGVRKIQINHNYPDVDNYHSSQYTYIENFIKTAEDALYGSNFKHPTEGWRKYFDEKSMADFIIVKEFAGDFDGYTSTQFYKRRGIDKIFFGPIWDVDKGWNNETRQDAQNPNSNLMIHVGFKMPNSNGDDWFVQVWKDEVFRNFVKTRWDAKKAQLTAMVMHELDQKPLQMAKAIQANFAVWKFNEQKVWGARMPAATYELEIERIRDLTQNRLALLNALFQ